MKNKYLFIVLNILVFGYLFYLLNPAFAPKGHWFSWQGTFLTALIVLASLALELSGLWKRVGSFLQRKLSK